MPLSYRRQIRGLLLLVPARRPAVRARTRDHPAAHGGRQAQPAGCLAGAEHRRVRPGGSCRARTACRRAAASSRGARFRICRRPRTAAAERRQTSRPRSARASATCPACRGSCTCRSLPHLPDARAHRDHVRVVAGASHDLHERRPGSRGHRVLDGRFARAMGGRHAGRRRHGSQRSHLVRHDRHLPQRPRFASSSATR